jgi:hypothetical protein
MDRLMEKGARDVHFLPVYMKKNRPAYELAVICDADKVNVLEQTIFQETTTIGIRRIRMERSILPREASTVMLREGELKIKKCASGRSYAQLSGVRKCDPAGPGERNVLPAGDGRVFANGTRPGGLRDVTGGAIGEKRKAIRGNEPVCQRGCDGSFLRRGGQRPSFEIGL